MLVNKRFFIFISLAFLILNIGYSLFIDVIEIKSNVYPNETAQYLVNFYNDENKDLRLTIYNPTDWYIVYPSYLILKKGEIKNVTVYMLPKDNVYGKYIINLYIFYDNSTKNVLLPINILGKEEKKISLPPMVINYDIPNKIILREKNNLYLRLKFYQKENITYRIYLDSNLIKTGYLTGEKGEHEFLIPLYINDFDLGKFLLKLNLSRSNWNREFSKVIEIIGYPNIIWNVKVNRSFYYKKYIVKIKNNGTAPQYNYSIQIPFSKFDEVFSSNLPQNSKFVDGKLVININRIDKNEELTYIINVNYIPLIILPLLLLGIILAYFFTKKEIEVRREIFDIREEDKIKGKVKINIINIGTKKIDKIIVRERIPKIIKVTNYHTVKPKKEKNLQIWEVSDLYPGEEVILSYEFETIFKMMGTLVFPEFKVEYIIKGKSKELIGEENIILLGEE